MKVQSFKDFESYSESIANADLRVRVLGFEHPGYVITKADVRGMHVQLAHEGSGHLTEGAVNANGIALYLPLRRRPIRLNGITFNSESVGYLPPGAEFRFAVARANDWCSIFIPLAMLFQHGQSVFPIHDSVVIKKPSREAMGKLHSMLTLLRNLKQYPSLLTSAAAECFQDEFLSVARKIAATSQTWNIEQPSRAKARHDVIAGKAAAMIESSLDRSISVGHLASELNVSERTLLTAFRSYLDVTPRQFILSLRLDRARAMLREHIGNPDAVRIGDVAGACGFMDFGRFSAKYRRQFGELPSETLGR